MLQLVQRPRLLFILAQQKKLRFCPVQVSLKIEPLSKKSKIGEEHLLLVRYTLLYKNNQYGIPTKWRVEMHETVRCVQRSIFAIC